MRDGALFGSYRVVRKIGEGGMGTVFLAEHALIGRRAAIKVLRPERTAKRGAVERFFNEARATTAIADPGIVQVFDFGFTADNVAYLVMELLEGEQLKRRLKRLGALAPADALRITRQAAGSLGAAHAANIVHRDLKPENLYMIRDPEAPGGERPKILDFGIAKLGDEMADRVRTRTGTVLGTPVYMSPEQCDGARRIDHRCDIYSLGCVLFHLLTGRPPFDLPGVGAIISAHLREPPPAPSSLAPHLPPGIDEIVLRCLAKAPDQRFASMYELHQACDALLALITGGALVTPASSTPIPRITPLTLSSPEPEVVQTTLGTSAGESLGGNPRRRFGLWLAIGVIAGGIGSTIAVVSARRSGEAAPEVRPAADGASIVAPADAGRAGVAAPTPIGSGPGPAPAASATGSVPVASATGSAPAASATGSVPSALPGDAGTSAVGSNTTRVEPDPARSTGPVGPTSPVAPATRKPVLPKPPARPKPRASNQDLYDERN